MIENYRKYLLLSKNSVLLKIKRKLKKNFDWTINIFIKCEKTDKWSDI